MLDLEGVFEGFPNHAVGAHEPVEEGRNLESVPRVVDEGHAAEEVLVLQALKSPLVPGVGGRDVDPAVLADCEVVYLEGVSVDDLSCRPEEILVADEVLRGLLNPDDGLCLWGDYKGDRGLSLGCDVGLQPVDQLLAGLLPECPGEGLVEGHGKTNGLDDVLESLVGHGDVETVNRQNLVAENLDVLEGDLFADWLAGDGELGCFVECGLR